MPFDTLFGPPVRIQPYFGYRSRTRLILGARALRARDKGFTPGNQIRAMRTMLSHFASREEAGIPVRLEVAGPGGILATHEGETDREGHVRFDIPLEPEWDLPPDPAWEVVALRWANPALFTGELPVGAIGLSLLENFANWITTSWGKPGTRPVHGVCQKVLALPSMARAAS